MRFKLLLFFYFIASLSLFLYSYTQVDLNLTLSRVSLWQTIQRAFQYVGYFQRPVSTVWYLVTLSAFFVLYGIVLVCMKRKTMGEQDLWKIVIAVTAMLVLSYPAFSYDMFNYMFTAKTVLIYQKNPYAVLPLQFAGIDPWINFMRWVHLPSAYTPLWIALTLPAYLFGFQLFLLILWNMKLLVAGFYLFSVWCVGAILKQSDKNNVVLGMGILALNPLIIIESLVSAHNDIAMMAFALLAIYLFIKKKYWSAWLMLALSIALKLMTIFLVPAVLTKWKRGFALVGMSLGLILVLTRREFLPWYFVWVLPFVALLPTMTTVLVIASGLSLGLLLQYAPYLYYGHWNAPVPVLKWWVTVAPAALVSIGLFLRHMIVSRNSVRRRDSIL